MMWTMYLAWRNRLSPLLDGDMEEVVLEREYEKVIEMSGQEVAYMESMTKKI